MSKDDNGYGWRVVGEGITERRKAVSSPVRDAQKPKDMSGALQQLVERNNAFFSDPLAGYREMHGTMIERYEALRVELGDETLRDQLSAEHERKSEAWWLREMVRGGFLVLKAHDEGDTGLALAWMADWMTTVTEYNIAYARGWNRYAVAGKKVVEGAQSTRKGARLARVAEIERLISVGTKVTAAFAIVAEAEGVTPKAIETDYYKARRKAS